MIPVPGVSAALRIRACVVVIALAAGLSSCWNSIQHDEALAKKRALDFARVAFVRQNFDRAYMELSESAKSHVALPQFKEAMARWHKDGYPSSVEVTGYKPVWNQKVAYVFMSGENSQHRFQYILTLDGSAESDYKVSLVIRTE